MLEGYSTPRKNDQCANQWKLKNEDLNSSAYNWCYTILNSSHPVEFKWPDVSGKCKIFLFRRIKISRSNSSRVNKKCTSIFRKGYRIPWGTKYRVVWLVYFRIFYRPLGRPMSRSVASVLSFLRTHSKWTHIFYCNLYSTKVKQYKFMFHVLAPRSVQWYTIVDQSLKIIP